MSARDRFTAAEDEARRRAAAAAAVERDERATAAREEHERREKAKRGPARPELGREFARRARDAGIEPEAFTHRYSDPSEIAVVAAWQIPTQGLIAQSLYVTTIGGVFVGSPQALLTAPWEHDATALGDEQLERLLAEFLVSREPQPPEPEPLSARGLHKAVQDGALDGLLLGSVPVLAIGILGRVDIAVVLLWAFPIGGAIVSVLYAIWQARQSETAYDGGGDNPTSR